MSKHTTHFKINFDWYTEFIRSNWAEGNYAYAVTLVTDNGLSVDIAHEIIKGDKKFVQDPNQPDGVGGMVVKDNWKPNLDKCIYWAGYPDPKNFQFFKLVNRYGVEGLSKYKREIEDITQSLQKTIYYFDKVNLMGMAKNLPVDVLEFFGESDLANKVKFMKWTDDPVAYAEQMRQMDRWAESSRIASDIRQDRLEGRGVERNLVDVERFVKRQIELDKMEEPPKSDPFAKTGWMSPKGELFPCGHMEHISMSRILGFNSEPDIEKAGWLKLTYLLLKPDDLLVLRPEGGPKPTQKQIDAIFDWATYHNLDVELVMEELNNA